MSVPCNVRIRRIRVTRKFSQQQIASLLGISRRTYSDYEQGSLRIPLEHLLTLARYYDVGMDYLTGISNIRSEYPVL